MEALHQFTIIVKTVSEFSPYAVHRAGCKDIAREVRASQGYAYNVTGDNAEHALAQEFPDEAGWTVETINIKPCVGWTPAR